MEELNKLKPRIIVSGMGYPYQEDFLLSCKADLEYPFVGLTCGGFLTQTAMKSEYYYSWSSNTGLRWFQRMLMHNHVRERLLKEYPVFVFKYLYKFINDKKSLLSS
jgi:UDP-Gal:alpha-D-GlcNAc-diphosphoundecaprenol beta-1,4-galactosyltransferase